MHIPVGHELIVAASHTWVPPWMARPTPGYIIAWATNAVSIQDGMRQAYLEATSYLVRETPGTHYYMGEYGETGVIPNIKATAGATIEEFFYVKKDVVTETFAGRVTKVIQLYDVCVKVSYPQKER